jgi:hypothetical protein
MAVLRTVAKNETAGQVVPLRIIPPRPSGDKKLFMLISVSRLADLYQGGRCAIWHLLVIAIESHLNASSRSFSCRFSPPQSNYRAGNSQFGSAMIDQRLIIVEQSWQFDGPL